MAEKQEHQWFQRARAGEKAAFDSLQQELQVPIRRYVRRLIGRSHAEDDIMQQAFLALYMNLERLDSSEAIRPFLFRVVRNLSYGELKRQGRFQPVPINEVLDESSTRQEFLRDHRPLPDEKLHWVLLYSEVRSAMKYLPELQRQTLILYSLENLTYTQIAEVMATDIGTVKSRIYYARQNLRKWLKPEILSALGIEKETKNGRNS